MSDLTRAEAQAIEEAARQVVASWRDAKGNPSVDDDGPREELADVLAKVDARRFEEETRRLGSVVASVLRARFAELANEEATRNSPEFVVSGSCVGEYAGCRRTASRSAPKMIDGRLVLVGACFQHQDKIKARAALELLGRAGEGALRTGYYLSMEPLDKLVEFARSHGADLSRWQADLEARGLGS